MMPTAPTPSVVGLILARLDSSRLPGKALKSVAGRPVIGYVVERARRIRGLSRLVLATTDRPVDDELADYAQQHGLDVCRGDAQDVAKRLLDCSGQLGAEYLLRLNGDSPFLDPALIAEGLSRVSEGWGLVSNVVNRTFPYGISVEIIRREALERAHPEMTREEREHVTPYFVRNPSRFRTCSLTSDSPKLSSTRMVVDTEEDLLLFAKVVHALGDAALTADYRQAAECYLAIDSTLL